MKSSSKLVAALVLALSAGIFLSGCGLSGPSERSVESQVRAVIEDGTEELFQVDEVTKTNGYRVESGAYVAEVSFRITFKVGMADLQREMEAEMGSKDERDPDLGDFVEMMEAVGVVTGLQMKYGNFDAGDSFTETCEYTFIRTERGWRIQTG